MIRYVVLSALCITSLLLMGPSPAVVLSLLVLVLSMAFRARWVRMAGLLTYPLLAFQAVSGLSLTDFPRLIGISVLCIALALLLLDISLAGSPYKPGKPSIKGVMVMMALFLGFIGLLFFLPRLLRIGVYLGTDQTVQVFIVMALTILLTAPLLVPSRPAGPVGGAGRALERAQGTKTNK